MLENLIIFVCLIWASLWEQRKLSEEYLADIKFGIGKNNGKLNVMSVLDEQDLPEFSKTRENLLNQNEINNMFTERKFEELIAMFGDRKCKSFYDLNREKTDDPRQVRTWPTSPSEEIRGPIEPLPDPYPDNCYVLGLNEEQMFQMKFLSKQLPSKGIQSDNYDADFNLRKDAFLIGHQRDLTEVERSMEKKKVRGRKNRYFKQIDNEDHEAGVLLDDDDEGRLENQKAKNELLDAQTSLEAKRVQENKKLQAEETRLRAM